VMITFTNDSLFNEPPLFLAAMGSTQVTPKAIGARNVC
jgi:hypothetical protein